MKKKKENLPTSDRHLGRGYLESKKKILGGTEKKILIISSIAVLLTFIIGVSYAYIAYTTRQKGINVLETDCINVTMEELTNAINLRNAYPVTDEVGSQTKPFRFKLENTCGVGVDYNINLEIKESENRINAKNIAVKVDENAKKLLNSQEATPTINESDFVSIKSYTTYSGSIEPYSNVTHEIRIWLDESAGNDSQNGTLYSKVVIEARQNQVASSFDAIQIGDYVSYTPSKTNFSITSEMTGCSGTKNPSTGNYDLTCNKNQSINPSELTLWRVIRKNDSDKTIEMVSENVSSNDIFFEGRKGFINYIYGLNQIAASYETEGVTKSSRHFGYDSTKATEKLDYIKNVGTSTAPWEEYTSSTNSPKGSTREIQGGGDYGYTTDLKLVHIAYGGDSEIDCTAVSCLSLQAKRINSDGTIGDYSDYWIASRSYHYYPNFSGSQRWNHNIRHMEDHEDLDNWGNDIMVIYIVNRWQEATHGYSIRPIVELLPEVTASLEKNDSDIWMVSQP